MGHFMGLQAAGPLDRRDGRGNLRDLPPRLRTASFTLTVRDRGVAQWKTVSTAIDLLIPDERVVGVFPGGFSVPTFNHGSAGNFNITPPVGGTLTEGSATGTYALLPGAGRLLVKVPDTINQWRLW